MKKKLIKLPGRQCYFGPDRKIRCTAVCAYGDTFVVLLPTKRNHENPCQENPHWAAFNEGGTNYLNGFINGYNTDAFDVAEALRILGLWNKKECAKFVEQQKATYREQNTNAHIEEIKSSAHTMGYALVRLPPEEQ